MLQKLTKSVLIILFSSFSNSFCALVELPPKKSRTVNELYRDSFSGSEIIEANHRGLLVLFLLRHPKSNEEAFQYFRKKWINDDLYLIPINHDPKLKEYLDFSDPELIKKCWDYRLLLGCELGAIDVVQKALDKGADPLAIDKA